MTAFVLVAGVLALGVAALYRLVVPPRVDLVGAVARWDASRERASRIQRIGTAPPEGLLERLAARLSDEVAARGHDNTRLRQNLEITRTTLEAHLTRVLGLALVGLIGPVVIVNVLFATIGLGWPPVLGPVLGVLLAAAMVVVAHRELIENATMARAEFRRALSTFLDLVAMSTQAGRGHAEALPASAAIGSGWTFTLLRDAIDGARFSGITPWHALGRLGDHIGVPELVDLDGALRIAHEDGAKVKATLVARAETLRAQRIADAEAEANTATESMKFALIVMVFAFLAYELYPSVTRLFAG
jgi:tight adherence protein C